MDLQKFTDRARGFIQAAQTIAMREGHQRLGAEHLLKALLDDSEGLASSLIQRAGGDPKRAAEAADAAVARQPKVSGGDGQIYMEQSLGRALAEAETLSKKAGDSFVTAERLLSALALTKGTPAAKALSDAGVDANRLESAIAQGPHRRQRFGRRGL
jgi:ATP-dependent Clp protease ATP-binding subunit ClpB